MISELSPSVMVFRKTLLKSRRRSWSQSCPLRLLSNLCPPGSAVGVCSCAVSFSFVFEILQMKKYVLCFLVLASIHLEKCQKGIQNVLWHGALGMKCLSVAHHPPKKQVLLIISVSIQYNSFNQIRVKTRIQPTLLIIHYYESRTVVELDQAWQRSNLTGVILRTWCAHDVLCAHDDTSIVCFSVTTC